MTAHPDLERTLHEVLGRLDGVLTTAEIREVSEFVAHREYGVGLETIADIARDGDKAFPSDVCDAMRDLAYQMGLDADAVLADVRSAEMSSSAYPH